MMEVWEVVDETLRKTFGAPPRTLVYGDHTFAAASLAWRGEEHLQHSEQRWVQRVYVYVREAEAPFDFRYQGFIHLRPWGGDVQDPRSLFIEAYLRPPSPLSKHAFSFSAASERFAVLHGEPSDRTEPATCYASPAVAPQLAACGQFSLFVALMTVAGTFPDVYGDERVGGVVSPFEITCIAFDRDLNLNRPNAVAMSPKLMAKVVKSDYVRLGCIHDVWPMSSLDRRREFAADAERVSAALAAYLDSSLPVIVFVDQDELDDGREGRRLPKLPDQDHRDSHSIVLVGYHQDPWQPRYFCYHDPLERPYIRLKSPSLIRAAVATPIRRRDKEGREKAQRSGKVRLFVLAPSGVGMPLSGVFAVSEAEAHARQGELRMQRSRMWVPPADAVSRWRLMHRDDISNRYGSVGVTSSQAAQLAAHIEESGNWVWVQEWHETETQARDGGPAALWFFYAGDDPDKQRWPLIAAYERGKPKLRAPEHGAWR